MKTIASIIITSVLILNMTSCTQENIEPNIESDLYRVIKITQSWAPNMTSFNYEANKLISKNYSNHLVSGHSEQNEWTEVLEYHGDTVNIKSSGWKYIFEDHLLVECHYNNRSKDIAEYSNEKVTSLKSYLDDNLSSENIVSYENGLATNIKYYDYTLGDDLYSEDVYKYNDNGSIASIVYNDYYKDSKYKTKAIPRRKFIYHYLGSGNVKILNYYYDETTEIWVENDDIRFEKYDQNGYLINVDHQYKEYTETVSYEYEKGVGNGELFNRDFSYIMYPDLDILPYGQPHTISY